MNTTLQPKRNILVIDDSKELLQVLELILGKIGHTVFIKDSPDGVTDLVQKIKIDLMLLDVRLKAVNGRYICQELKSNSKTNYFPIILMSSYPSSLVHLKECAGDDFIEKPFTLDNLVSKVSAALTNCVKH